MAELTNQVSENKEETRGRPTVMTPDVINKLEQAFSIDATVSEACTYAGIAKATYYEFVKGNPEYMDKFDALREKPVLLARQTVVNGIKDSFDNAMRYLERKKKKEFSSRQEVTGEDGAPISIIIPQEIAGKNNLKP